MEFNGIVAACVVVTAAGWALERGLKQAAETNRQREEYRVYENAGGLLLTIMIALIVFLFVCRAVYPEYLNGKNSLFFYAIGVCAIVNLVREIFLFFTMRITVTAMEISYRDRRGRIIQRTGMTSTSPQTTAITPLIFIFFCSVPSSCPFSFSGNHTRIWAAKFRNGTCANTFHRSNAIKWDVFP